MLLRQSSSYKRPVYYGQADHRQRSPSGRAAREVPLLLGPRFFSDINAVLFGHVNQRVQGQILQL